MLIFSWRSNVPSQDIIRICGNDEARSFAIDTHRKAEFMGIKAGQDIAKVTGRHDKLQCLVGFQGGTEGIVGGEIVDDLGQDPGPIDRVDCTQSVGGVEVRIVEQALDDILSDPGRENKGERVMRICSRFLNTTDLAIIKRSLDG